MPARILSIALLAVLLAIGQVGVLLHGVFHAVEHEVLEPLHDEDGDVHGGSRHAQPCGAFDGLIGAAACGSVPGVLLPARVAATAAQYYFRYPIVRVAYSTRAPPALRL